MHSVALASVPWPVIMMTGTPGHLEIAKHGMDFLGAHDFQGLPPIMRDEDPVSVRGKNAAQALADDYLIVHDQYGVHPAFP